MSDPSSSMSPVAMTVMAVVVIALAGLWVALVFHAGHQPEKSQPDGEEHREQATTTRIDVSS
jgi:hypothetical protein